MYKAVVTNKGRTVKNVRVDAPKYADTQEVLSAALEVAGETRASLFGWDMNFWESSGDWTVSLYTD